MEVEQKEKESHLEVALISFKTLYFLVCINVEILLKYLEVYSFISYIKSIFRSHQ